MSRASFRGRSHPSPRERAQLLKKHPKHVQKAVNTILQLQEAPCIDYVLLRWDIGRAIDDMAEVDKHEGESTVLENMQTVADVLYIAGGYEALNALRKFAAAFERTFVSKWLAAEMADGCRLGENHWLVLVYNCSRETVNQVEKWLAKTIDNCWTWRELESEILGRGAHPVDRFDKALCDLTNWMSPIAGLHRCIDRADELCAFTPRMEQFVFDTYDDIVPERLNDVAVKSLTRFLDVLDVVDDRVQEMRRRATANLERCKSMLAAKRRKEERTAEESRSKAKGRDRVNAQDADLENVFPDGWPNHLQRRSR